MIKEEQYSESEGDEMREWDVDFSDLLLTGEENESRLRREGADEEEESSEEGSDTTLSMRSAALLIREWLESGGGVGE